VEKFLKFQEESSSSENSPKSGSLITKLSCYQLVDGVLKRVFEAHSANLSILLFIIKFFAEKKCNLSK